jgi:hypothetical protein
LEYVPPELVTVSREELPVIASLKVTVPDRAVSMLISSTFRIVPVSA